MWGSEALQCDPCIQGACVADVRLNQQGCRSAPQDEASLRVTCDLNLNTLVQSCLCREAHEVD
jgi:hypothetical protein